MKDLWSARAANREQNNPAAPETAPADANPAVATVGSLSSSSLLTASGAMGNVLDSYLSGQPKGADKYLRAQEMAGKMQNSLRNAQFAILGAGMVAGQLAESYADKALAGKQAAEVLQTQKGEATLDESQKNLDEIQEDVEERAEEAVNPEEKDVTASPDAAPGEKTAEADAAEKDVTDMEAGAEDVGIAAEAVPLDATVAAGPMQAAANTSQPQQAQQVQQTGSVDIIV